MSMPLSPASPVRPTMADARRAALGGLVDYAGLFPPASLDMEGAVAGYRAARRGDSPGLLGRFICPAPRLGELAAVLVGTMDEGEEPWPVSMLATGALEEVARHGADFQTVMGPAARIEIVEGPLPGTAYPAAGAEASIRALGRLGARSHYFEVTPEGMEAALAVLAGAAAATRVTVGAKIRCGGLRADLFPTPDQVAGFMAACRLRSLPFKATAGLHHPFRHEDPDTGFTHHGFLNLLSAAVLGAVHDLDAGQLLPIVAERDPGAFSLTRRALAWRHLEADAARVRAARAASLHSYGSCDFAEPAADLADLGVLPFQDF